MQKERQKESELVSGGDTGCSRILQNKSQRPQAARKQAKSLRKTHLGTCLTLAQEKEDKERASTIKHKMGREENIKMWTIIKYVVKDPRNSQVLKVQRVGGGVVCEYVEAVYYLD